MENRCAAIVLAGESHVAAVIEFCLSPPESTQDQCAGIASRSQRYFGTASTAEHSGGCASTNGATLAQRNVPSLASWRTLTAISGAGPASSQYKMR
jgi:hypothetical protein